MLAKARLDLEAVSLFAMAGPRWDFLLSSRGDGYELLTDQFRTTSFGGIVAGGFDLSVFHPICVGAELRYALEFHPAYDGQFAQVTNRAFSLLLSVSYQVGDLQR